MPEPTVSKHPKLVIFGGPLTKSRFSAVSAAIFHANMITGNIWPRVHGQLWLGLTKYFLITNKINLFYNQITQEVFLGRPIFFGLKILYMSKTLFFIIYVKNSFVTVVLKWFSVTKNFIEQYQPRGGLHSVVSHNSVFGNQEIRQLELWNFARWEVLSVVPRKILWRMCIGGLGAKINQQINLALMWNH